MRPVCQNCVSLTKSEIGFLAFMPPNDLYDNIVISKSESEIEITSYNKNRLFEVLKQTAFLVMLVFFDYSANMLVRVLLFCSRDAEVEAEDVLTELGTAQAVLPEEYVFAWFKVFLECDLKCAVVDLVDFKIDNYTVLGICT